MACNQGKESCNHPALPKAIYAEGPPVRGQVRKSRMGRRRAIVLIAIHVLALAHILHWKMSGSTVSPLEPSEAMYTLRDGLVNAGAILMIISTVSVLIFGRFFCGWACHMVAVQDFCAWLLKRAGIKPRPLRSRFLTLIPFGAAFVMFGMPLIYRHRNDLGAPDFSAGFIKEEFWETFPGPWLTIATFAVSGFLMVYVLGAKGFCTYACPYGGVFALGEKLAPGRIRVTDACKACGHCTAVCTSNVQVTHEIQQFGMVVNAGCMKCLDCISSCPEEALYFGFGKPALLARAKSKKRAKLPFGFDLATDLAMVIAFVLTLTIFAGLPDTFATWATSLHGQSPMLFSLSLSALTAFVVGLMIRGQKSDTLHITNHALRSHGQWTKSGRWFLGIATLWLLFVGHSGLVQYYTFQGNFAFNQTDVPRWAWERNKDLLPDKVKTNGKKAMSAFAKAESLSLFSDVRYPARLAGLAMALGKPEQAIKELTRATKIDPSHAGSHSDLASVLHFQQRWKEALEALKPAIELEPDNILYQRQKLSYAQRTQNPLAGVEAMEAIVSHTKGRERHQTLVSIAMIRLQLGHRKEAEAAAQIILKEHPGDPQAQFVIQELKKSKEKN